MDINDIPEAAMQKMMVIEDLPEFTLIRTEKKELFLKQGPMWLEDSPHCGDCCIGLIAIDGPEVAPYSVGELKRVDLKEYFGAYEIVSMPPKFVFDIIVDILNRFGAAK